MRLFYNINIILLATLALLSQSCVKGIEDGAATSGLVTLTIDVACDKSATRAGNLPTLAEDFAVDSLRVFVLNQDGRVEFNQVIDGADLTVSSAGVYYAFDVVASPNKSIYVVVNEPSGLSSKLNDAKNQFELNYINYDIADELNNRLFIAGESLAKVNRTLPMCGVRNNVDAISNTRVVVHVDRVVARVDLMVDKDDLAKAQRVEFTSATSVSVTGLFYDTHLFDDGFPQTPAANKLKSESSVELSRTVELRLHQSDRSSAKRLLSFYMAERAYNIDSKNPSENRISINIDNVTVDGATKELASTILLGNFVQPYLTEINRNYVYRIFATYKGEEQSMEVSGEYAIMDWTIEELDGDIEGVMVSVANRVVMDWTRLNNSLTAKDIAFGSNRAVEFYIPTSYDVDTKKYEFAKCNIVARKGATYDLLDMSQYGVADQNNYLLTAGWLTGATIRFESEVAGYLEFDYFLAATPYYLDSVPIQIVSANVRKQISVLYDNGYVPGSLLQENDITGCWGDAHNGVAFTKRGDALHPLTTEEIFLPNGMGLYQGDIQMSAAEADQYCKRELGPKWYIPNKAQLQDIQRHVLELGTSYRFNNSADTYYWSSESDVSVGGNYWAVNFTKAAPEAEAISAPASTQYYVRCISNL